MWIFTALRRSVEDPRNRLTQLLVLSIVVTVYFYVYFYQNIFHIQVPLIGINTLIEMPIMVLVVIPLVKYLIVKPDPLQRSPSQRRPIRFFQNEFPSRYILERCQRCVEDENSCSNYIKAESYAHIRYWFNDIFHGAIEREDPKSVRDTFEKGYTCKLLYYLSWVLGIFCGLAIVTVAVYHTVLAIVATISFLILTTPDDFVLSP